MTRPRRSAGSAPALLALAALSALGGCASARGLWPQHEALVPAGRQVAVFDGHELWADFACEDGSTFRVRYLGGWAEVTTPDGTVYTLVRGRGIESGPFTNAGYSLSEAGLSPTWTTPAGVTRCTGRLA